MNKCEYTPYWVPSTYYDSNGKIHTDGWVLTCPRCGYRSPMFITFDSTRLVKLYTGHDRRNQR